MFLGVFSAFQMLDLFHITFQIHACVWVKQEFMCFILSK